MRFSPTTNLCPIYWNHQVCWWGGRQCIYYDQVCVCLLRKSLNCMKARFEMCSQMFQNFLMCKQCATIIFCFCFCNLDPHEWRKVSIFLRSSVCESQKKLCQSRKMSTISRKEILKQYQRTSIILAEGPVCLYVTCYP